MDKPLRSVGRAWWIAMARPAFWRILILGLVVGLSFILPAGTALAQTPVPGGGGAGLSGISASLATMAKLFVDFLIGLGAILLAVGFATGFVQGQASAALGMPHAMASMWMKIGGIIVCFIGLLMAIPAANAIIDGMSGFAGAEPIHLPK